MILPKTLLCLGVALGVVASVASCSVSALSVNDSRFRAVWSPGWAGVRAAIEPLKASSTGPGACNIGGGEGACVATSVNTIAALSKLEIDLAAVETPPEYRVASTTIQHAIRVNIKALTDRVNGVKTHDNSLWTTANDELKQAEQLFSQGYAQFPPETRPAPQPFQ
jgi:hypothetical protein